MRPILIALMLAAPLPAIAQPAAAPSPNRCAALAADYDMIERRMAGRTANAVGDNDAGRGAWREIEDSNDLSRAQIILTLLQHGRCPLPDHAPSAERYSGAATACAEARLREGVNAPVCNMANWRQGRRAAPTPR